VQYRYGLALYLNHKLDQSAVAIERACDLAPESVDYRYMLTGLLQRLGRYEEALSSADRLIQLQPANQSFHGLRFQLNELINSPKD
jgi:tetratricopeptide (TPR) repeat protein